VASGSYDQTIRLWDARTGAPIGQPLEGHTHFVTVLAFGAIDSRAVIVSGSYDETIRLWDARTGAPIGQPLKGHTGLVNAVALGAFDGRAVVASGSWDKTVRLWDARTGVAIGQPLEGHTSEVTAVALGAVQGRAVVISGSRDQTIRIWDAQTHLGGAVVTLGAAILATAHQSDAGIAVGLRAGLPSSNSREADRHVQNLWRHLADHRSAGQIASETLIGDPDHLALIDHGFDLTDSTLPVHVICKSEDGPIIGSPKLVRASGDGRYRPRGT
jgi:WD40 repeat protein